MLITHQPPFCNTRLGIYQNKSIDQITINGESYDFRTLVMDWQDTVSLREYLASIDIKELDYAEITVTAPNANFISDECLNTYISHYGIDFLGWYVIKLIDCNTERNHISEDGFHIGLSLFARIHYLETRDLNELFEEVVELAENATMEFGIDDYICDNIEILYDDDEQHLIVQDEVTQEDIERAVDHINNYRVVMVDGSTSHPQYEDLRKMGYYPSFAYLIP